jgi:ABC-type lipoprotein export system ATPase subunit
MRWGWLWNDGRSAVTKRYQNQGADAVLFSYPASGCEAACFAPGRAVVASNRVHMNSVPSSKAAPAVQTSNVCRYYPMGGGIIRAVDGISLTIERGEFVALLGQSGSGKSTLLNLLAGLDRPSSGSVMVQGRDLAMMSSEELAAYRRNDVGMVFQAFHLIPSMTITENVELPMRFAEVARTERGERVRESLEQVGLGKRLEHRPSELSGGEQQRVSLARALANRPSLLLADEPTGNLDSRTGEDILNLIRDLSLSLGMTVVMVTHERALAERFAQRLVFLADGKLLSQEAVA